MRCRSRMRYTTSPMVHNLSYLLDTPIAIRVREKRGKGLED